MHNSWVFWFFLSSFILCKLRFDFTFILQMEKRLGQLEWKTEDYNLGCLSMMWGSDVRLVNPETKLSFYVRTIGFYCTATFAEESMWGPMSHLEGCLTIMPVEHELHSSCQTHGNLLWSHFSYTQMLILCFFPPPFHPQIPWRKTRGSLLRL